MITTDDVISMAREVNLPACVANHPEALKRFAALVAAKQCKFDAALVDYNAMACENPIWRSLLQANANEIRNGGPIDDEL